MKAGQGADQRWLERLQRLAGALLWLLVGGAAAMLVFTGQQARTLGLDGVSINLSLASVAELTALGVLAAAVWLFAAGRKRRVLFLRKFGRQEANSVVGAAIRRGLGRHARLFVLDDSRFRAVRVPWSDRLGALVLALPFVLFALLLSQVRIIEGPLQSGTAAPRPRALDHPWTEGPSAIFLWLWAAAVAWPLLSSLWVALRPSVRVVTPQDLARLVRRIAHAGRWVAAPRQFAPLMTLVRTDDAIWQATVEKLVRHCDLVIFDLGVGSEALRWEIETCQRLASDRTVFVVAGQGQGGWHGLDGVLQLPPGRPRAVARALAAEVMRWPVFGIRVRLGLEPGRGSGTASAA